MSEWHRRIRILSFVVILLGGLAHAGTTYATQSCQPTISGTVVCYWGPGEEGPCTVRICCIGGNPEYECDDET